MTKLRVGRMGFDSWQGLGYFLTIMSRQALRSTQPPTQWVLGVLSLGIKWPVHEADHSPPSSAEVKNAWSYTSIPPIFMVWCLITIEYISVGQYLDKHRDKFTFTRQWPLLSHSELSSTSVLVTLTLLESKGWCPNHLLNFL
jgi:hypothetical protein